jgi:protein-S-isoprenylcysteine O-methyltransferase Ste14
MNLFKKWAQREYSIAQRVLALIPAGVLFAFLLPLVLARVVPAIDQRLGLPSIAYGMLTLLVGIVFIVTGLIYALWSIVAQLFRARGTPLPMMATQKLLVSGPFRHCRNPMSFGTILLYLGISITVGSISAIATVLVFTTLLVLYIKLIEEKELEARFGKEYVEYKAGTPFLVPRIFPKRS